MHTKGKLHLDETGAIVDEDGGIFAMGNHPAFGSMRKECAANSRRLVALWNAADGISTEALEAGAVRKLVEAAATLMDVAGLLGKSADPKLLRPDQNAAVAMSKADRICAAWRDVKAALEPFKGMQP